MPNQSVVGGQTGSSLGGTPQALRTPSPAELRKQLEGLVVKHWRAEKNVQMPNSGVDLAFLPENGACTSVTVHQMVDGRVRGRGHVVLFDSNKPNCSSFDMSLNRLCELVKQIGSN